MCWNSLEFLRGDSKNFMVRGHHSVLSPVQLLLCTSDDMMKKMVHHYEQCIVEQIKYMICWIYRDKHNTRRVARCSAVAICLVGFRTLLFVT